MKKGISRHVVGSTDDRSVAGEIVGDLNGMGHRFGVVVSRFNRDLTQQLLDDAVQTFREAGVSDHGVHVVWVPGAYEIPSVLEKLAEGGGFSALLAFGVVIQGETPHADLIGREVAHHSIAIARTYSLPILDGVVLAGSYELAEARSTRGSESRGTYVARAALEMANVFRQLEEM